MGAGVASPGGWAAVPVVSGADAAVLAGVSPKKSKSAQADKPKAVTAASIHRIERVSLKRHHSAAIALLPRGGGLSIVRGKREGSLPVSGTIDEIARNIAAETDGFTGGPIARFGDVGLHTLNSLKRTGMHPSSTVLDVGCGALRLGYWLIRFLQPDRYHGIDPKPHYIAAGLKHAIGPKLAAEKRPRFDNNTEFDFSCFGVKFDFVVARSIFSHASPAMVCRVLESFRDNSTDRGVMLVSYKPILSKENLGAGVIDILEKESRGGWSWRRYGKAHLRKLAKERGLFASNFGKPFNGQIWLRVSKTDPES